MRNCGGFCVISTFQIWIKTWKTPKRWKSKSTVVILVCLLMFFDSIATKHRFSFYWMLFFHRGRNNQMHKKCRIDLLLQLWCFVGFKVLQPPHYSAQTPASSYTRGGWLCGDFINPRTDPCVQCEGLDDLTSLTPQIQVWWQACAPAQKWLTGKEMQCLTVNVNVYSCHT